VIAGALRMVAIGCAAGIVGAAVAGPFARGLLFETSPYDSAVHVTAIAILLLVTIVAAFVPAVRAARVSPMTAMRVE
jgi:putative ABC transport system permease protein